MKVSIDLLNLPIFIGKTNANSQSGRVVASQYGGENMSGKGDKPRPFSVDRKTFDDNWNRIFNKGKKLEMWFHNCKYDGAMQIERGAPCNWCGATEDER